MKKLLPLFLTFFLVLIGVYLSFLFVLPKYIDLDKYAPNLERAIYQKTDINVYMKNLHVKTSWDLKLSANVKKADLFQQNTKFAQINDLNFKIALIPLLFKKIEISEIKSDKFIAIIKPDLLDNFIKVDTKYDNGFKFSDNLPDVKINYYRITFLDPQNNYTIKGNYLRFCDFILSKKVKIKTNGKIILNEKNHIIYDVNVITEIFSNSKKTPKENLSDLFNCFKNILKYNVFCSMKTDLNIKKNDNKPNLNGKIDISELKFICGGKKFPPSHVNLVFKDTKVA